MKYIKRQIAKTISYRLLATLVTIIISYILTNDIVLSSEIGVGELFFKPFMYFIHERAWHKWFKIQ